MAQFLHLDVLRLYNHARVALMDRFPNISTLYLLISRADVPSLFSFSFPFLPASSSFLDVYYDITVVYAINVISTARVYPKAAIVRVVLTTSP